MSKKTLLTESQIRRFMTLANQQPLASGYIGRGRAAGIISEQDEDLEDEMLGGPPGLEDEDADPVGPDAGMDDLGAPEEGGADIDEATVEELVGAIARAIGEVTGVEVSVEGGAGPEEDMLGGEEGVEDLGGLEGEAEPLDMAPGLDEEEPMMEMRRFVRAQLSRLLSEGAYKRDDEKEESLEEQEEDNSLKELLQQALAMAEGHKHTDGGEDMLNKGTNTNRDFEKDDNRQSSAGEKHTGGGKASASRTHMGGNNAALPLEETVTDDLVERVTRRVAAKLLNKHS